MVDLIGATMTIDRVDTDRYGRTLAMVYVDGRSLSCAQLAGGHASYIRKWDNEQRVAAECMSVAV
jgi:endonuclease YncB( thermonuclease family)